MVLFWNRFNYCIWNGLFAFCSKIYKYVSYSRFEETLSLAPFRHVAPSTSSLIARILLSFKYYKRAVLVQIWLHRINECCEQFLLNSGRINALILKQWVPLEILTRNMTFFDYLLWNIFVFEIGNSQCRQPCDSHAAQPGVGAINLYTLPAQQTLNFNIFKKLKLQYYYIC